ncbi:hypothetical protein DXV76_17475 [Rhodobacteraceae bacterium CCMM004]|nr:hypothetical protein DXV76_17475 [Rhodobacteraceae bacterium CCMM004]
MRHALFALALTAGSAAAQDDFAAAQASVDVILAAAMDECRAAVVGDPQAPEPELVVEPPAVTWVDLDGEDYRNDVVLDFNHVLCSLNFSLWHGTGGSLIHLITSDGRVGTWTGGLWRMDSFGGRPLVLIGRHGGRCDGYGAQPCVEAVSVFEDGFSTIRPAEDDPR